MDDLIELFSRYSIPHEVIGNTHPETIVSTGEHQMLPDGAMGLRRSSLQINAQPIHVDSLVEPESLWNMLMPRYYMIGDHTLICIVECMDLGEFPIEPKHIPQLNALPRLIPKGTTLIGCDSSYLLADEGIRYIAYTDQPGDLYPTDPIHPGCGLDLIVIRPIAGTLSETMSRLLTIASDGFNVCDKTLGAEAFE